MKRSTILNLVLITLITGLLSACGPANVEKFVSIEPNETAFLVPLEGASKSGQKGFMSVDYLNENKAASKRISLPLRKWKTGRLWYDYEWIPTMRVVKVNRTPITREWTGDATTGSNTTNDALWVESADSIGFGVGVNVTGLVSEEDSAQFLYYYASTPLSTIMDNNVRGYINSVLSREFAKHQLEQGRGLKNEIFLIAKEETIAHFADKGVTISNLGLAEGLVYRDKEIQTAINDKFTAEMQIQIESQTNLSQEKINTRNVAIATAEKDAAKQFAMAAEDRKKQMDVEIALMNAKANLKRAENWNGALPANILPSNSPLLMSVGTK